MMTAGAYGRSEASVAFSSTGSPLTTTPPTVAVMLVALLYSSRMVERYAKLSWKVAL